VLLPDIFQSEDYFKKLTALKEADLNKFLKLAQLVCPFQLPSFALPNSGGDDSFSMMML
jgi:hypothetical protein